MSFRITVAAISFIGAGIFYSAPAPALPIIPGFNVEIYAAVSQPMKISFDSSGVSYVGRHPESSTRIHRIEFNGAPVTEYGPPVIDPDVVLFDAAGVIAGVPGSVLVGGGGVIAAIFPDQSSAKIFGPGPNFTDVDDMKFDKTGRLVFSDDQPRILVSNGGPPTVLIADPFDGERPNSIAIDAQNRIFASGSDGTIRIWDADGKLVDGSFAAGLSGHNIYLAFGPGGIFGDDLYVLNGSELLRFDSLGNSSLLGQGFSVGPASGTGFIFGPDQALYVSEYNENRILRISAFSQVPEPPILALFGIALVSALVTSRHKRAAVRLHSM